MNINTDNNNGHNDKMKMNDIRKDDDTSKDNYDDIANDNNDDNNNDSNTHMNRIHVDKCRKGKN